MVKESGEREFKNADEMNIPVDVWLTETEDEEGNKDGTWTLSAANYVPRKAGVHSEAYEAISENKDELMEIIKKHIIPLYKIALKKLNLICEGKTDNLYYWEIG